MKRTRLYNIHDNTLNDSTKSLRRNDDNKYFTVLGCAHSP